jgi:hypothetical protein
LLPLVDGFDLHQFASELLILGDQFAVVKLYCRDIKHCLSALTNPQMDECRKGKETHGYKSTVRQRNPQVPKRDAMERPESCGNIQQDSYGGYTPEHPLGTLGNA